MPQPIAPASPRSTTPILAMASTGCCCLPPEASSPKPAASGPDIVDARGLKCPLPVLKMEKRLAALPSGVVLVVLATDEMARVDIPLYCRQHGHAHSLDREGTTLRFTIVSGGDAPPA